MTQLPPPTGPGSGQVGQLALVLLGIPRPVIPGQHAHRSTCKAHGPPGWTRLCNPLAGKAVVEILPDAVSDVVSTVESIRDIRMAFGANGALEVAGGASVDAERVSERADVNTGETTSKREVVGAAKVAGQLAEQGMSIAIVNRERFIFVAVVRPGVADRKSVV